jgi:hypothetical protein
VNFESDRSGADRWNTTRSDPPEQGEMWIMLLQMISSDVLDQTGLDASSAKGERTFVPPWPAPMQRRSTRHSDQDHWGTEMGPASHEMDDVFACAIRRQ